MAAARFIARPVRRGGTLVERPGDWSRGQSVVMRDGAMCWRLTAYGAAMLRDERGSIGLSGAAMRRVARSTCRPAKGLEGEISPGRIGQSKPEYGLEWYGPSIGAKPRGCRKCSRFLKRRTGNGRAGREWRARKEHRGGSRARRRVTADAGGNSSRGTHDARIQAPE